MKPYQILTNDDEVCIASHFWILLAVITESKLNLTKFSAFLETYSVPKPNKPDFRTKNLTELKV